MNHSIRLTLAILGVLGSAGCTWRDPYLRNDVWKPTHSNAANLAATIVDPRDLVYGKTLRGGSLNASLIALERIETDQPKLLGDPRGGAGVGVGGGPPAAAAAP